MAETSVSDIGLPPGLGGELDAVLARAGVTVWAADDEEHGFAIRHWSPGAEKVYGYSSEEALGQSYLELFVAEDKRAEAEAEHKRLLADPDAEIQWQTTTTDVDSEGKSLPVFYSSFPMWWERYERYLLVEVSVGSRHVRIVDESAPRAGDQALVTSEAELDKIEGKAVTNTFQTIVPLLIHRVGNAVDAIVTESGRLSRQMVDRTAELPSGPQARIGRIQEGAGRIGDLLEELDALSDGVPPRSSLVVRKVVESTRLAFLSPDFKYVEVRNDIDPGLAWTTHEVVLREVLSVLITNACEAVTRDAVGGDVEVTAELLRDPSQLVIRIDDNGPGLRESAFAMGRRRLSTKGKSHGRGLFYAERALDLIGGRLSLSREPSPLGGARVAVVLDESRPGLSIA